MTGGGTMKNKLKEIRTHSNITISELSKNSKVSERYLRFIETGDKTPSLKTAKKIADSLNTSVDEIFYL